MLVRQKKRYLISAFIFLFLLVGTGVGFILLKNSQDVRQQASGSCEAGQPYCSCDTWGSNCVLINPEGVREIADQGGAENNKGIISTSFTGERPTTDEACAGVWMNEFCYMPGDEIAGGYVVIDSGRYNYPYLEKKTTYESLSFGAETVNNQTGSVQSLGEDCGGNSYRIGDNCYAFGAVVNGYLVMPDRTSGCDNSTGDYCYAHLKKIEVVYDDWRSAVDEYEKTGDNSALEELYLKTYGISFEEGELYDPKASNAKVLRAQALISALTSAEVLQKTAQVENQALEKKGNLSEEEQATYDFNQRIINYPDLAKNYQILDQLNDATSQKITINNAISQMYSDLVMAEDDANLNKLATDKFKEIFGYDPGSKYGNLNGILGAFGIDPTQLDKDRDNYAKAIAEATEKQNEAIAEQNENVDKLNQEYQNYVNGQSENINDLKNAALDSGVITESEIKNLTEADILALILSKSFSISLSQAEEEVKAIINARTIATQEGTLTEQYINNQNEPSSTTDLIKLYVLYTGRYPSGRFTDTWLQQEVAKYNSQVTLSLYASTGEISYLNNYFTKNFPDAPISQIERVIGNPEALLDSIYGPTLGGELYKDIVLPKKFNEAADNFSEDAGASLIAVCNELSMVNCKNLNGDNATETISIMLKQLYGNEKESVEIDNLAVELSNRIYGNSKDAVKDASMDYLGAGMVYSSMSQGAVSIAIVNYLGDLLSGKTYSNIENNLKEELTPAVENLDRAQETLQVAQSAKTIFNPSQNLDYATEHRSSLSNYNWGLSYSNALMEDNIFNREFTQEKMGYNFPEIVEITFNQLSQQIAGVDVSQNIAENYAISKRDGYTGPADTRVADLALRGAENMGFLDYDYQTTVTDQVAFERFRSDPEIVRSRQQLNYESLEKVVVPVATAVTLPVLAMTGVGAPVLLGAANSAFSLYQGVGMKAQALEMQRIDIDTRENAIVQSYINSGATTKEIEDFKSQLNSQVEILNKQGNLMLANSAVAALTSAGGFLTSTANFANSANTASILANSGQVFVRAGQAGGVALNTYNAANSGISAYNAFNESNYAQAGMSALSSAIAATGVIGNVFGLVGPTTYTNKIDYVLDAMNVPAGAAVDAQQVSQACYGSSGAFSEKDCVNAWIGLTLGLGQNVTQISSSYKNYKSDTDVARMVDIQKQIDAIDTEILALNGPNKSFKQGDQINTLALQRSKLVDQLAGFNQNIKTANNVGIKEELLASGARVSAGIEIELEKIIDAGKVAESKYAVEVEAARQAGQTAKVEFLTNQEVARQVRQTEQVEYLNKQLEVFRDRPSEISSVRDQIASIDEQISKRGVLLSTTEINDLQQQRSSLVSDLEVLVRDLSSVESLRTQNEAILKTAQDNKAFEAYQSLLEIDTAKAKLVSQYAPENEAVIKYANEVEANQNLVRLETDSNKRLLSIAYLQDNLAKISDLETQKQELMINLGVEDSQEVSRVIDKLSTEISELRNQGVLNEVDTIKLVDLETRKNDLQTEMVKLEAIDSEITGIRKITDVYSANSRSVLQKIIDFFNPGRTSRTSREAYYKSMDLTRQAEELRTKLSQVGVNSNDAKNLREQLANVNRQLLEQQFILASAVATGSSKNVIQRVTEFFANRIEAGQVNDLKQLAKKLGTRNLEVVDQINTKTAEIEKLRNENALTNEAAIKNLETEIANLRQEAASALKGNALISVDQSGEHTQYKVTEAGKKLGLNDEQLLVLNDELKNFEIFKRAETGVADFKIYSNTGSFKDQDVFLLAEIEAYGVGRRGTVFGALPGMGKTDVVMPFNVLLKQRLTGEAQFLVFPEAKLMKPWVSDANYTPNKAFIDYVESRFGKGSVVIVKANDQNIDPTVIANAKFVITTKDVAFDLQNTTTKLGLNLRSKWKNSFVHADEVDWTFNPNENYKLSSAQVAINDKAEFSLYANAQKQVIGIDENGQLIPGKGLSSLGSLINELTTSKSIPEGIVRTSDGKGGKFANPDLEKQVLAEWLSTWNGQNKISNFDLSADIATVRQKLNDYLTNSADSDVHQHRAELAMINETVNFLSRVPGEDYGLTSNTKLVNGVDETINSIAPREQGRVSGRSYSAVAESLLYNTLGARVLGANDSVDLSKITVGENGSEINYALLMLESKGFSLYTGTPETVAKLYKMAYGIDLKVFTDSAVDDSIARFNAPPAGTTSKVFISLQDQISTRLTENRNQVFINMVSGVHSNEVALNDLAKTVKDTNAPYKKVLVIGANGELSEYQIIGNTLNKVAIYPNTDDLNARTKQLDVIGERYIKFYEYGAHVGVDTANDVDISRAIGLCSGCDQTTFSQGINRVRVKVSSNDDGTSSVKHAPIDIVWLDAPSSNRNPDIKDFSASISERQIINEALAEVSFKETLLKNSVEATFTELIDLTRNGKKGFLGFGSYKVNSDLATQLEAAQQKWKETTGMNYLLGSDNMTAQAKLEKTASQVVGAYEELSRLLVGSGEPAKLLAKRADGAIGNNQIRLSFASDDNYKVLGENPSYRQIVDLINQSSKHLEGVNIAFVDRSSPAEVVQSEIAKAGEAQANVSVRNNEENANQNIFQRTAETINQRFNSTNFQKIIRTPVTLISSAYSAIVDFFSEEEISPEVLAQINKIINDLKITNEDALIALNNLTTEEEINNFVAERQSAYQALKNQFSILNTVKPTINNEEDYKIQETKLNEIITEIETLQKQSGLNFIEINKNGEISRVNEDQFKNLSTFRAKAELQAEKLAKAAESKKIEDEKLAKEAAEKLALEEKNRLEQEAQEKLKQEQLAKEASDKAKAEEEQKAKLALEEAEKLKQAEEKAALELAKAKEAEELAKAAITKAAITKVLHSIGRNENNSLQIIPGLSTVSRNHAQLIQDGNNNLYIRDLSSTNGTYVNNQKIIAENNVLLKEGDLIFLGNPNSIGVSFKVAKDSNNQLSLKPADSSHIVDNSAVGKAKQVVNNVAKSTADALINRFNFKAAVANYNASAKSTAQNLANQIGKAIASRLNNIFQSSEEDLMADSQNIIKDDVSSIVGDDILNKLKIKPVVLNLDQSELNFFNQAKKDVKQSQLIKDLLNKKELIPKKKIIIEGITYYFLTDIIKTNDGSGYLQVVIYSIDDNSRIIPRSLYKSNSDGGWRSTPYFANGIYSKGNGVVYTQETKVHDQLNIILNEMESNGSVISMKGDFIKDYFNIGAIIDNNLHNFAEEVKIYDDRGALSSLQKHPPGHYGKEEFTPQIEDVRNLIYPDGFIPDFTQDPFLVEKVNHTLLGPTVLRKYIGKLNDRPVVWVMATDGSNRVWIDRIYFADSKLTSYGVYDEVINSGILTNKPLEYASQAYYLDQNYKQAYNGRYVDITPMLENLLPIRQYKEAQSLKQNQIQAGLAFNSLCSDCDQVRAQTQSGVQLADDLLVEAENLTKQATEAKTADNLKLAQDLTKQAEAKKQEALKQLNETRFQVVNDHGMQNQCVQLYLNAWIDTREALIRKTRADVDNAIDSVYEATNFVRQTLANGFMETKEVGLPGLTNQSENIPLDDQAKTDFQIMVETMKGWAEFKEEAGSLTTELISGELKTLRDSQLEKTNREYISDSIRILTRNISKNLRTNLIADDQQDNLELALTEIQPIIARLEVVGVIGSITLTELNNSLTKVLDGLNYLRNSGFDQVNILEKLDAFANSLQSRSEYMSRLKAEVEKLSVDYINLTSKPYTLNANNVSAAQLILQIDKLKSLIKSEEQIKNGDKQTDNKGFNFNEMIKNLGNNLNNFRKSATGLVVATGFFAAGAYLLVKKFSSKLMKNGFQSARAIRIKSIKIQPKKINIKLPNLKIQLTKIFKLAKTKTGLIIIALSVVATIAFLSFRVIAPPLPSPVSVQDPPAIVQTVEAPSSTTIANVSLVKAPQSIKDLSIDDYKVIPENDLSINENVILEDEEDSSEATLNNTVVNQNQQINGDKYVANSLPEVMRISSDLLTVDDADGSNICGPLAASLMQDGGYLDKNIDIHEFWLLNDLETGENSRIIDLKNFLPENKYDWFKTNNSIKNFDPEINEVSVGDLFYLKGGNPHWITITKIDSQGRIYATTNIQKGYLSENDSKDETWIIAKDVLMYDPQNSTVGQFYKWAVGLGNLHHVGFGGYLQISLKNEKSLIDPKDLEPSITQISFKKNVVNSAQLNINNPFGGEATYRINDDGSYDFIAIDGWKPINENLLPSFTTDFSRENYLKTIDFFNVDSSKRYSRHGISTYCNIFVSDVTKAMGVYLPHWIEGQEMSAADMKAWINSPLATELGWYTVSAKEAQALANQGIPTVAVTNAHIAMIIPGNGEEVDSVFYPSSAQAGKLNFDDGTSTRIGFQEAIVDGEEIEYFSNQSQYNFVSPEKSANLASFMSIPMFSISALTQFLSSVAPAFIPNLPFLVRDIKFMLDNQVLYINYIKQSTKNLIQKVVALPATALIESNPLPLNYWVEIEQAVTESSFNSLCSDCDQVRAQTQSGVQLADDLLVEAENLTKQATEAKTADNLKLAQDLTKQAEAKKQEALKQLNETRFQVVNDHGMQNQCVQLYLNAWIDTREALIRKNRADVDNAIDSVYEATVLAEKMMDSKQIEIKTNTIFGLGGEITYQPLSDEEVDEIGDLLFGNEAKNIEGLQSWATFDLGADGKFSRTVLKGSLLNLDNTVVTSQVSLIRVFLRKFAISSRQMMLLDNLKTTLSSYLTEETEDQLDVSVTPMISLTISPTPSVTPTPEPISPTPSIVPVSSTTENNVDWHLILNIISTTFSFTLFGSILGHLPIFAAPQLPEETPTAIVEEVKKEESVAPKLTSTSAPSPSLIPAQVKTTEIVTEEKKTKLPQPTKTIALDTAIPSQYAVVDPFAKYEILPSGKILFTQRDEWNPVDPSILPAYTTNRNTTDYLKTIELFQVEVSDRYRRASSVTYCNIYASDVTKALGVPIPRWENGEKVDANRIYNWLQEPLAQEELGWKEITAEEAQQLANQGIPTVATTPRYAVSGGTMPGHIAMIIPGEGETIDGVFYPSSAQAGNINFDDGSSTYVGFAGALNHDQEIKYFANEFTYEFVQP